MATLLVGMLALPPVEAGMDTNASEVATFGMGCFWCTEAVFERVPGVLNVVSGYMGGTVPDPTYRQVCEGTTGHAEVSQIRFDPARVSYAELLDYFWQLHDPTTPNRQGNDVGPQYRSAIFYHSEAQRTAAEASKAAADASGRYQRPVVTEVTPASVFYPAEEYHQDYFAGNREVPYCRFVVAPKVEKMERLLRAAK